MSLDLGQLGGFQDGSKILDVWVVLAELQAIFHEKKLLLFSTN